MNSIELGILLRQHRKLKGKTIREMAGELEMSFPKISDAENGFNSNNMGIFGVLRMVEYVGLTLELRPAGREFAYTLEDAERDNEMEPGLRM